MSSSISYFIDRTKDAETVVIDRADYGAVRMLTSTIRATFFGGRREHWMLRARGPYDFRLMAGSHVPIQLCAGLHPLLAEDREPLDALELTGPVRSAPLVLGALFMAHVKWAEPTLLPFGTFMVPGFEALRPGPLALGPRSFVNAMRIQLARCEASFQVCVARAKPRCERMAIQLGKANYVRASAIVAEEIALDRDIT